MYPWKLVGKEALKAGSQQSERGDNQTPKQSRVQGDEQRLSMNLKNQLLFLIFLLLERFPQQMS